MKAEERKVIKKEMKKGKKTWIVAGSALILLVAAVITAVLWKEKLQDGTKKVPKELEQYMSINLFPGFDGVPAKDIIEVGLSNQDILLEYAGSYDGTFYEDGKNEEKKDVFSLILTNVEEDVLEVMQLWIEDEKGETYQFQVAGLPSGGTVLAQELDGKKFRKNGQYKVVRDNFGFLDLNIGISDLEIEEVDDKIYVTNNSSESINSIQLIYKNWLGMYAYPGGIAYRISLEEIKAGATLEITADHYRAGESKITGIKQVRKPEGEANGTSTD